jgi:hypothetical protein
MTPAQPSPALARFVDALVDLGGPLTSIVSHMRRHRPLGPAARHAPSIPERLRELLPEVLGELEAEHPEAELDAATRVLLRASERICEDVFLVEPPLERRGPRRRRR